MLYKKLVQLSTQAMGWFNFHFGDTKVPLSPTSCTEASTSLNSTTTQNVGNITRICWMAAKTTVTKCTLAPRNLQKEQRRWQWHQWKESRNELCMLKKSWTTMTKCGWAKSPSVNKWLRRWQSREGWKKWLKKYGKEQMHSFRHAGRNILCPIRLRFR